MTIGENIKKFRKEKGLTQKQLAEAIGKNIRTIQAYESNTIDISYSVLYEIAHKLDVATTDLIGHKKQAVNSMILNEREKAFVSYLNSLGYYLTEQCSGQLSVFDQDEPALSPWLNTTTPIIIITRDNKETFLTAAEFDKFKNMVSDFIEFQLWQKK